MLYTESSLKDFLTILTRCLTEIFRLDYNHVVAQHNSGFNTWSTENGPVSIILKKNWISSSSTKIIQFHIISFSFSLFIKK